MEPYLLFIPLGCAIGAFGTLIGAGGGFVLMPVLLLIFPKESPETMTSISLAIVFFNAFSGSWAYAKMGRIDYKSAWMFSAATIPGAILGSLTTAYIPRQLFNGAFGLFMMLASGLLFLRPGKKKGTKVSSLKGHLQRVLRESDGTYHFFSYNPAIGIGLSICVGYISSLLGIGGGIIHVPVLVHFLNFPIHIATATSLLILSSMAFTGSIVHLLTGAFSHGIGLTMSLAIGVLIGAQLGARFSNHVHGDWIIRCLAIAIGFVGIRILIMAFYG